MTRQTKKSCERIDCCKVTRLEFSDHLIATKVRSCIKSLGPAYIIAGSGEGLLLCNLDGIADIDHTEDIG